MTQADNMSINRPTIHPEVSRQHSFEAEIRRRRKFLRFSPAGSVMKSTSLQFAETVRRDLRDLRPRDMIDAQSFLWVQGSEE